MSRNHLDEETSPYLLQHRNNPVHWRAWTPATLAEAKSTGKPILLSVGYAACHWCHVMAHESFEDQATAAIMNELFIPIKVDREERPDIDSIYQAALALLGQQGGWPLTMFLTPEAEPFWGGTYFPPTPRFGRPAFREVLTGIANACTRDPDKIAGNVSILRDALARNFQPEPGSGLSIDLLDKAAFGCLRAVDQRYGGMSGAPKFPQTSLFTLLWRAALRTEDTTLRNAVTLTLDHMSQGGIYDHLGGGFARYSTDDEWLAPHFEKMLYDNAQLIELLTLVWQDTKSPLYAHRVAETITWVLREMMAEHNAFAATIDADSEGEEGKFYVWSAIEIEEALPSELVDDFIQAYDVTPGGNWEGKTILNRNAGRSDGTAPVEERLANAREILLERRSQRVPPDRDDKILTDWNGMMIAALANAAFAFQRPDWLNAAQQAFQAIQCHLTENDRLVHSLRTERKQADAMLDDYAQMSRAALILYEVTGNAEYLSQAKDWVRLADLHYWDDSTGGYYFTADDAPGLILRIKTAQDHATPSGNGVMVEVLARLFHHTGEDHYRQRAEDTVAAFSGELSNGFPSMTSLLNGWEILANAVQIVIISRTDDHIYHEMLEIIATTSLPNRVLTLLSTHQTLPKTHPAAGKVVINNTTTTYVCIGPICSPPINDPRALRNALTSR